METNVPLFYVNGCDSAVDVAVTDVNVNRDDFGPLLDLSSCDVGNDLIAYLNCVASNNSLPAGANYVVTLEGDVDECFEWCFDIGYCQGTTPHTGNKSFRFNMFSYSC